MAEESLLVTDQGVGITGQQKMSVNHSVPSFTIFWADLINGAAISFSSVASRTVLE